MKIELKNLTLGYDKNIIINDQSLEFIDGKINAIIGKNGCGKSTLFKALSKQLKPINGKLFLNDLNITKINHKDFVKNISILFQENVAPNDITVRKLISYGRFPYIGIFSELSENDNKIIDESIDILDLKKLENYKLNELSSGQKQMVWLAMLLAQDTKIILLDEPTTYLDLKNQFQIMNCIQRINKELNKTIILILHDINLVSMYADYVYMLKDKQIKYYGKTNDILTKNNIKDIFDINVSIFKDNNKTLICPIN